MAGFEEDLRISPNELPKPLIGLKSRSKIFACFTILTSFNHIRLAF
jgi:hypothetical protein